nr:glutamate 5-kinase [Bradyrhizobium sp. 145]
MGQRTLASARRIVVKIGSALIVDEANGTIRESWLDKIAEDVARVCARGQDVILVSSGAVAVGRHALNLQQETLSKGDRQAAAALGQMYLAKALSESFSRYRLPAAQVLLTLNDTTQRQRILNARAVLIKLLTFQTIPVLNENDAVASSIERFGDNDRLAARVARLAECDTLILLSNVAGLYSGDPFETSSANLIKEVHEVTPEIEGMAGGARSDHSSGGMVTKLAAARMALGAGINMVIADGRDMHPLSAIDEGKPCTWFLASAEARGARKRRIGATLKPTGVLVIDDAAVITLRSGEGLYPAGVISHHGEFGRGDSVVLQDIDGNECARGLVIHSATELRLLTQQPWLLCRSPCQIVHRDDLALVERPS